MSNCCGVRNKRWHVHPFRVQCIQHIQDNVCERNSAMTTEGHFVHPATTHTKAVDAILQIKIKLESEVRQFRDGEKLW